MNSVLDHRYRSFIVAGGIALTALPFVAIYQPSVTIELPAILFFAVYLTLSFLRLRRLTATYLKQRADVADAPAFVILGVTTLAITAAVGALFLALNREQTAGLPELAMAFAAVVLGWLTIHTMAAMHYAHVYWRPSRTKENGRRGGLDFPDTPDPCGHDFLYFSLVIGMTAQTSDVVISSTAMRKLNLVHATVSYFFNTVLVAAAVNAAVSLAG
ncbi:DUF1345 domain-containing protein [Rhizobium glycinendophyticum]|uniref:DUF1345 domain-containing protein n=1 Tax=Rhizobium glycinendophyticum TaxID=2589807 RepID=A0A504UC25_9HYPH|nr:DUF1345 domain-containing protein [Rhizobium glycinendophyticum]TPP11217.1 DUF1345 domain-containing protein [Rhizobium glycinendophyticum]